MTERLARNGTYRESGYGFHSLVGSRLQREMLSLYILKFFRSHKSEKQKKETEKWKACNFRLIEENNELKAEVARLKPPESNDAGVADEGEGSENSASHEGDEGEEGGESETKAFSSPSNSGPRRTKVFSNPSSPSNSDRKAKVFSNFSESDGMSE